VNLCESRITVRSKHGRRFRSEQLSVNMKRKERVALMP
jgi:hypothetical protein